MLLLGLFGAGGGLYFFISNLRHIREIRDTPRSKVRSAAQGYVKIEGRAMEPDSGSLISELAGRSCVWYRFNIEERKRGSRSEWKTIEKCESDSPFRIADDTGDCLVDPRGATVVPAFKNTWYGNDRRPDRLPGQRIRWWQHLTGFRYRYTEERIHSLDPCYVIGELTTTNAVGLVRESVRETIVAWKQDMGELKRRFDSNRDGVVDVDEWEKAQATARDTVLAEQLRSPKPAVTTIGKPPLGARPFIISAEDEKFVLQRKRMHSAGAALAFIAGVAIVAVALMAMPG
jgi:hypothetical protein